jgi:GT2 family glycosyltransferase
MRPTTSSTDTATTIGAAIVHYRFWPQVRRTIDALLAQTAPPDHVIVIENGSGDGSLDALRQAYPQVEVVSIETNVGPIAAMNRGIELLIDRGVDTLLLLTHETLLAPDAVERMRDRLDEDERIGAVGPVLGYLSDRDRVWSAGGTVHGRNWDTGHMVEPRRVADWVEQPPHQVDWMDGACLLLRPAAVRAAGPLNDAFWGYFDEPDHQLRMRRAGWRVECVPAAVAWQEPGGRLPYLFVRNRLGFIARRAPRRQLVRELLRVTAYGVRDLVHPRPGVGRREAVLRLKGMAAFLRGRWGRPEARLLTVAGNE